MLGPASASAAAGARDPYAKAFEYRDREGAVQGPFSATDLASWMAQDWFPR
jgi:hypothetical protein